MLAQMSLSLRGDKGLLYRYSYIPNHDIDLYFILCYKIQSVCVSACLPVCFLVRNRFQNHAYYGDEAFAGDSVGIGLGQRLDFMFRKGNFGEKSPLTLKILFT